MTACMKRWVIIKPNTKTEVTPNLITAVCVEIMCCDAAEPHVMCTSSSRVMFGGQSVIPPPPLTYSYYEQDISLCYCF